MVKKLFVLFLLCWFWTGGVWAGNYLEYNAENVILVGPFLDYLDGVAAITDVAISSGVGACSWEGVACTDIANNTWSHVANGYYSLTLDAGDVNTYGRLLVSFYDVDDFIPVWHEFTVVTTNVYDSFGGDGADKLQVDVVQLGDSTQSGTDLKDFSDAGYNPATDKVTGVLLTDTCTANTDLVSAAAVVNEWESQSQTDPTGFYVNVQEVDDVPQTANDNGADINTILTSTAAIDTSTELRTLLAGSDTALATATALGTAQTDLNTLTGSDGATLATAQGLYAPAKAGDAMTLSDDAITLSKFDESTAFPLVASDAGAAQVARVGADSDTLEVLSDEIAALVASLATVDDIADGVWDETSTGHVTAGYAGEQLWTDVDAILVDTAVIGALGVGLTAIPWNSDWDTEVQSECDDAITANTYIDIIKQLGLGRMTINETANTMVIYDDDDTGEAAPDGTPLVTFDLKDIDGNAAHSSIYERIPE